MKFVCFIIGSVLLMNESFASSHVLGKDVESNADGTYSEQNIKENDSVIMLTVTSDRGLENSTSTTTTEAAVVDEFIAVEEVQHEEGVTDKKARALVQDDDNPMKGKIRGRVRKAAREKRDLHWYHGGSVVNGKGGRYHYQESYSKGKGKGGHNYRYSSASSDDDRYYYGGSHHINVPAKGSAYYPAKGSTHYPSKGSAYYPAKGSTQYPAKGSTQYPAKGSTYYPAKGTSSRSKGSSSRSKGGSKGATYNAKGSW